MKVAGLIRMKVRPLMLEFRMVAVARWGELDTCSSGQGIKDLEADVVPGIRVLRAGIP
jgi:hypothetical protein